MEVSVHYLICYFMTPVSRVSTLEITYCLHFKGLKTGSRFVKNVVPICLSYTTVW